MDSSPLFAFPEKFISMVVKRSAMMVINDEGIKEFKSHVIGIINGGERGYGLKSLLLDIGLSFLMEAGLEEEEKAGEYDFQYCTI